MQADRYYTILFTFQGLALESLESIGNRYAFRGYANLQNDTYDFNKNGASRDWLAQKSTEGGYNMGEWAKYLLRADTSPYTIKFTGLVYVEFDGEQE